MTMTTQHLVAPEDVMALLDGELSLADARVVRAHLDECNECTLLSEKLRGTSESLSRWSIPAVPRSVEESVAARGKTADSRHKRTVGKGFVPWKALAVGAGAIAASFVLTFAMALWRGSTARTSARHNTKPLHQEFIIERPSLQDQTQPGEGIYSQKEQPSEQAVASKMSNTAFGNQSEGAVPEPMKPEAGVQAPMIARVMSLSILVKDAGSARAALDAIVARHHGYPARLSDTSPVSGSHGVHGSLRVPEDELASTAAEIRVLGRVLDEYQSGDEVSQQHADLIARLKTARETEARFQAILQQRTGKISDVLEVEQNISRVRGDIEGMDAELKALEHRVAFATIDVQLNEVYKEPLVSQPDSASTQMRNALVRGYRNATEMLLGIVLFAEEVGPSMAVWLVILGVPAALVWRRRKRLRAAGQ